MKRAVVGLLCVFMAGCGLFTNRPSEEPQKSPPTGDNPRKQADARRSARLDELGRRIHPEAEPAQLRALWLDLRNHPPGMYRRSPSDLRRVCAYQLRVAAMLFEHPDEDARVAHAVESAWRFKASKYAPCREDAEVGAKFVDYVARANEVFKTNVVTREENWADAAASDRLLLVNATYHYKDHLTEEDPAFFFNGSDKQKQKRPNRWAAVHFGGQFTPEFSVRYLVLLRPKAAFEHRADRKYVQALRADAVALGRVGQEPWFNWLRWTTHDAAKAEEKLLPRAPSIDELGLSSDELNEAAPDPEPAPPAEPNAAEPEPPSPPQPRPEPQAPKPQPAASKPPPPRHAADTATASSDEVAIHPLVWAGFGVGAVGVIVGAISGGVAASQTADLESRCGGTSCNGAITQSELDDVTIIAHVSTVGFAVGGAGLALGVIGLVLSDFGAGTSTEVTIGPGHLLVQGSF